MWQSLRHQCPLQLQSLHTIHRASTTPIAYQAWHLRATQSHHHLKQRYEHDQQACLLSKNTLQQEEVREHIHTHANTHTHAHTHCNVNIHKLCLQVTTAQCHKHDKHTQAKTGICCSRTSNSHHSMFSTNFVSCFLPFPALPRPLTSSHTYIPTNLDDKQSRDSDESGHVHQYSHTPDFATFVQDMFTAYPIH